MLSSFVVPVKTTMALAPVDATTFSLPGSNKRDWLLHMVWMQGRPVNIRLTKAEGKNTGESLKHLENVPQNAIYMGDRAYGTPTGLAHAKEHDWYFIVRFTWNNLPLFETRECKEYVRPEKKLHGMKCGEIVEFNAWAKGKKYRSFPAADCGSAKRQKKRRKSFASKHV